MAFDYTSVRGYMQTTNTLADSYGSHIASAINATAPIDNGWVGVLGDFVKGDARSFELPTGQSDFYMAFENVDETEGAYYNVTSSVPKKFQYYMENGVMFRVLQIEAGSHYEIANSALKPLNTTDGVQVGNFLVIDPTSYKLKEATAAPTEKGTLYFAIEDMDRFKNKEETQYVYISGMKPITTSDKMNMKLAYISAKIV